MIHRILGQKILEAAQKMPVVAVTGPRQSGKSTLIKKLFASYRYANLEDLEQRRFALSDPKGFLKDLGERAVIDEVQHAPELLSYIQVIVDEKNVSGLYVLSGSQNLLLMQNVSQSLAGRVAIFNLLPFSLAEIHDSAFAMPDYEDYILKGFYPRIYDKELDPTPWLMDYLQTYVERDVRQIINVADLNTFRQFLEICAGRIGQLVNFSAIGSQVGVSYQTVNKWISLLQTSFIVHTLRPYHRNFDKRLVKSPKLYFYDVGLACALLNIRSKEELNRHFAKGALFENFVINEVLKNHLNENIHPGQYFWQDRGVHEIDLLLDQGGVLYPIEIKSGRTLNPDFFDGLKYFQKIGGAKPEDSFLVYGGNLLQERSVAHVLGWEHLKNIPKRVM
ncbi:MAG: ATP-binding protein [Saprospiraceae bacterium]|nr:ATP-binding protein [Saprospiraceae bacterium]